MVGAPPQGYGRITQEVTELSGAVYANGSEQYIIDVNFLAKFNGWIDLSEMLDGDEVILSEYIRLKNGGGFKRYAAVHYKGIQESPAIRISMHVGKYGLRLTLKQTMGEFKKFDYIIWTMINFI